MSKAMEQSQARWLQYGLLVAVSLLCSVLLVDVQGLPDPL